ncbi:heparin lyase I family protein [Pectobacterium aroidearum]|uniref:heparin lyase I family protein n=1 Tax=Pectobacterium aroidearum TaxID=1201031 RepID=UPI0026018604|nr:heparin lyase I family protein [Pectobacterium aroidearum]WKA61761.1 heparin lyase I family protein [Pectobacterium aroidearum]
MNKGKGLLAGIIGSLIIMLPFSSGIAEEEVSSAAVSAAKIATKADFSYTASVLSVAFDGGLSSFDLDRAGTYQWDFGDGATSTEIRPQHTYAKDGHYTVSLTVEDINGRTQILRKKISVRSAKTGFENGWQLGSKLSHEGAMQPMYMCTTQSPNWVSIVDLKDEGISTSDIVGTKAIKSFWTETGYDYTTHPRLRRGAEACAEPGNGTQKEAWIGFMVYLPSKGYPMDKRGGIFQLFSSNGSCTSWAGMLTVVNNSLMFSHRTGCVTPTEPILVKDIPRDRWIPVIVHVVVSRQQQGQVELWFDGAPKNKPTYSAKNINFGFGVWRDDDTIEGPMHFTFGQYAWNDSNYTPNETRVNYFDNIHIVNEGRDDGWENVNPLTANNQYTGAQVWANRQWEGSGVQRAFDGDINTKYAAYESNTPLYLQYRFPKGESSQAVSYKISSTDSSTNKRYPRDWTLLGSNDGVTWNTLDQQMNQYFGKRATREFQVATPGEYSYYRLRIDANNGASVTEVGDIVFLDK